MDEPIKSGALGGSAKGKSGAQPEADADDALVASLQAAADASSGEVENEIGAFLNGEGALLETTRAAVLKSGSTAVTDVAEVLAKQFGLSSAVARVVAALVVKLLPKAEKKAAKKKKAKKKPTTKPGETTSSKKKPKKKPAKPKTAASKKKPKAKKETAKKPKAKK